MYFPSKTLFVFVFFLRLRVVYTIGDYSNDVVQFDVNYQVSWGYSNIVFFNQRREIQLSMNHSSGSGFFSKSSYEDGLFEMRMKLHNGDTAGLVTAFYLTSNTNHHDELDFEFLGNSQGKNITLQTNVFVDGIGNREQRMFLWFDPSADFHNYKILLNQHQIVFYVDEIPIRLLKNNGNKSMNYPYPSQAMQITASLWNGEGWATDGGKTKINWSHSPFKVNFKEFQINGCPSQECYDSSNNNNNHWWNEEKFWDLNVEEDKSYKEVKKNYMYYDYCTEISRLNNTVPLECL